MMHWRECSLPQEREQVQNLLQTQALEMDLKATYTGGIFEGNDLVATGSLAGHVIEMVAVREDYQKENMTGIVLTHLINRLREQGITKYFLYCKPSHRQIFMQHGFQPLVELAEIILMENRIPSITQILTELATTVPPCSGKRAALVMNCNPLTNGHLHLIDTCASQYDQVLVFLVEEDRSVFPYKVRRQLLEQALIHRPNVVLLPSTVYQISAATFPTYFIKENSLRARLQMEIDIQIFRDYFMPIFSIEARYAGTEPLDPMTAAYNQTMHTILLERFIEIPRLKWQQQVVSASLVRRYARLGEYENMKPLVPEVTFDYLTSDKGKALFHE